MTTSGNEVPASAVDLTLILHESRWRNAIPDTERFARSVIDAALLKIKPRVPAPVEGRLPEIACLFTNDAEIRILNRQFRSKDSATNILSFAADRSAPSPEGQPVIIGDMILSLDTIEREARDQNKAVADHVAHMLVHGVLHLFGYDHMAEKDATEMESLEREILSGLGIGDPYRAELNAGVTA